MVHSAARLLKPRLIVFLASAVLLASSSQADAGYVSQTFTLNQSNTFADGVSYGTVKVDAYNGSGGATGGLQAGQVRFTVTINTTVPSLGSGFALDKFGFNTNLTLQSTHSGQANYIGSPVPSSPPSWSIGIGSQNMDGFGNFSVEFQSSGQNHWVTPVEFDVYNLDTTGKSSTDLLNEFLFGSINPNNSSIPPAQGSVYFAAHVANDSKSHYIGALPGDGGDGGTLAPEPTSVTLTLIGFAGVGLSHCWRRLRKPRLQLA